MTVGLLHTKRPPNAKRLLTLTSLTFLLSTAPILLSQNDPFFEIAKKNFSTPDRFDIEYPNDEEPSPALIELGKVLFFDNRLSSNNAQSCGTCHDPDLGFGDGKEFSLGAMGLPVSRNTPHLYNLAWNSLFFWDGRSASLEEQALNPIEAEGEMNMSLADLSPTLQSIPGYKPLFKAAFHNEEISNQKIAAAISAFERSLIVDNTPLDKYLAGDLNAIGADAKRGLNLFVNKAKCIACHDGPNLTDNSFHNIGLSSTDTGRKAIIDSPDLNRAFKVPGLRNNQYTAPYMHDGSIKTIEAVIRFYNRGGDNKENLSSLIQPLNLSENEIKDLVAFLATMNQEIQIERPILP